MVVGGEAAWYLNNAAKTEFEVGGITRAGLDAEAAAGIVKRDEVAAAVVVAAGLLVTEAVD